MSFSSKVKVELLKKENRARHCDIAEIVGMFNTCGEIVLDESGSYSAFIHTENPIVAKKFFKLVKKTFAIPCDVSIRHNKQFKRTKVYYLTISNSETCEKILNTMGFANSKDESFGYNRHLNTTIIKSNCCKKAYLRGAFIAGGSMGNPEKAYHIEFVNSNEKLSASIAQLINFFELNAKMIARKGSFVVYLKESEQIADLLNIIEAHISLMELENVRIYKGVRNNVNRIVNFETANLDKTVSASITQVNDINYIIQHNGTDFLSEQLLDVAELRLKYPEASLKEIGAMLSPQVGKSGVNHRLRKISEISNNLRGGLL